MLTEKEEWVLGLAAWERPVRVFPSLSVLTISALGVNLRCGYTPYVCVEIAFNQSSTLVHKSVRARTYLTGVSRLEVWHCTLGILAIGLNSIRASTTLSEAA